MTYARRCLKAAARNVGPRYEPLVECETLNICERIVATPGVSKVLTKNHYKVAVAERNWAPGRKTREEILWAVLREEWGGWVHGGRTALSGAESAT